MKLTLKQVEARRKSRMGVLQKKILLLLLAGISLGCTRNPNQYFRVIRETEKEWEKINQISLDRSIRSLYKSNLLSTKSSGNGTLDIVLTKNGRKQALMYNIDNLKIKTPVRWDGKWNIIMFDIPEKIKHVRDSLRMHLKNMGFYEFQKSVFIHPYTCTEEIEYIVNFYQAQKYIHHIIATHIDNERDLKKHFSLA